MALNRLVEAHEQMVAEPPRRGGKGRAAAIEEPGTVAKEAPQERPKETPRRAPKEAVREAPKQEAAPTPKARPAAKRPAAKPEPPPPPPPPPLPSMPEPDEAGFALPPIMVAEMDAYLRLAGAVDIARLTFELMRLAAPELTFGMPSPGPVWPKFDQNTLIRPGRPSVAIASIPSVEEITLIRFGYKRGLAVFPSGELDTRWLRPARYNLPAAPLSVTAPSLIAGYYLPELPEEALPACSALAPDLLGAGLPAIVQPASPVRIETGWASFAHPRLWLPERDFQPVDELTEAPALDSVVADWVATPLQPLGAKGVLLVAPTPRRRPRPAIPAAPIWISAASLAQSTPVLGHIPSAIVGGQTVAAMASLAGPAAFPLGIFLPEAEQELATEIARAAEEAASDLIVPVMPVMNLPVPAIRSTTDRGPARPGAPLFAPGLPSLPESLQPGSWTLGIPGRWFPEAPLSTAGLPAPIKPEQATRLGDQDFRLEQFPGSPLFPLISDLPSQRSVEGGEFLEASSTLALDRRRVPFVVEPRAEQMPADRLNLPTVEATGIARSLTAPGAVEGAASPSASAGQRNRVIAPGSGFVPEPQIPPAPAESESSLRDVEFTPDSALRALKRPPTVSSAGPVTRDFAVSLPLDGGLPPAANLSSSGCLGGAPAALPGPVPQGRAELSPPVPAPGAPQMDALTVAPEGRITAPISDLCSLGLPGIVKSPGQSQTLPPAGIAGPVVSMPETPAPTARHTVPQPESMPEGVPPLARDRRPVGSSRQDLLPRRPGLPELASTEKGHTLTPGEPLPSSPRATMRRSEPRPPVGSGSKPSAPKLPGGVTFQETARLSTGEAAGLLIRGSAWERTSHVAGWANFPEEETRMPDPRRAALGPGVLGVGRMEASPAPVPKVPRKASPERRSQDFPLAAPLQPGIPAPFVLHDLSTMPPTSLPPVARRGTPQTPWQTAAAISGRPPGLPGCDLEVSARLFLTGQEFETPAPAKSRDAAKLRDVRRAAAPIPAGEEIHQPKAALNPVAPLKVNNAEIQKVIGYPNPWNVTAGWRPVAAEEFPQAPPEHAQSRVISARCTLDAAAAWPDKGRARAGAYKASPEERVGLPPQEAMRPAAQTLEGAVRLTFASWLRAPERTFAGAQARLLVGWQPMEKDSTSKHFDSISSRIGSVVWPTGVSDCFQVRPKPPARSAGAKAAPPTSKSFPAPAAQHPESAPLAVNLSGAPLSNLRAAAQHEDKQTRQKTVRLSPLFRSVRRPGRLPVFHIEYRRAEMPSGVFRLVEAHEDFEDYGTMRVAAQGDEPPLPGPRLPVSALAKAGKDLGSADLFPAHVPAPDLGSRPIEAVALHFAPQRPEMAGEVAPIPVEFDPALAEAGKGKMDPLVGAIKNASRFFKFMVLGVPGLVLFSALLWNSLGSSVVQSLENRAAIRLEQDFGAEMKGWFNSESGSTAWQQEPGGFVRVGELALYRPSMKMNNYRLEFLGQIERQSMGWVFRASDLRNYYAMKIVVVKQGPMPSAVLERYAVIDGEKTQIGRVPLQVVLHNGRPYRVQLRVFGDGFTTRIDGKVVDFWSDDRLRAGGVGFFSASGEDRAHLYWMRVAYQDDFWGKLCAAIAPS